MGDAVAAAKSGQKVASGYYNVGTMLEGVIRHSGVVGTCGSCIDARGIGEATPMSRRPGRKNGRPRSGRKPSHTERKGWRRSNPLAGRSPVRRPPIQRSIGRIVLRDVEHRLGGAAAEPEDHDASHLVYEGRPSWQRHRRRGT